VGCRARSARTGRLGAPEAVRGAGRL